MEKPILGTEWDIIRKTRSIGNPIENEEGLPQHSTNERSHSDTGVDLARNVFRNGASLYRVIQDAPGEHLRKFLLQNDANFHQLHEGLAQKFATFSDEPPLRQAVLGELNRRYSDEVEPIEVECRRVLSLADSKGPLSLRTLVQRQLSHEECEKFDDQPGDLARSIWAHVNHRRVFDDAVSFNAIRSWRHAGRLFAAFNVDLDGTGGRFSSSEIDTAKLARAIGKKLKTSKPMAISLIDLPEVPEYRRGVLVIVRFAGQQTSVATHGDRGERRLMYYLPQDEAILVYTPEDERVEVAATRAAVRNSVAECFAAETLGQDLSAKPLSSAVYKTHRFLQSVDLPLPDIEGFLIQSAKVVELELRVEDWHTRLSLKAAGQRSMSDLVERYLRPSHAQRRALGVSRVLVAVRYNLPNDDTPYLLEVTISDGNNCNLNSERDPKVRNFGRKLLDAWGILQMFRDLNEQEAIDLLPVMAELWDLGQKLQKGSYFTARGIQTKVLEDARLIRRKEIDPILIEEVADEEVEPPSVLDRTVFTIDLDWLEERLLFALKGIIDVVSFRSLGSDLATLGALRVDGREVPCYLARGLHQTKTFNSIDERLRGWGEGGPGIVFTGRADGPRLIGANVVIPILSAVRGEFKLDVDRDAILHLFRAGRALARGAGTLELVEDKERDAARVIFPDRPPLDVIGLHPVRAFRLLVEAARSSLPGVAAGELIKGSGSTGFQQMFAGARWSVVKEYVEQVPPRRWKLKGY